jgi:hypothetical protein
MPPGDDDDGPFPFFSIPTDPPLTFTLACLLAQAAPPPDVLAALGTPPGLAAQRALVDALAAARAWVGGSGALGPPGYAPRLLRRAVGAAAGRRVVEDEEEDAVDEGLAAALAAALLEEDGCGPDPTPAFHSIALVFGRPASPATLLRLRASADLLAGDTGCAPPWPAAVLLGAALAGGRRLPRGRHHPAGRPVLELGAGTGALGLLVAKACAPASLTLTDGDAAALSNAAGNVAANGFAVVEVVGAGADPGDPRPSPPLLLPSVGLAHLVWGDPLPPGLVAAPSPSSPPLLVLGADITYDPASAPALAGCLAALLSVGGGSGSGGGQGAGPAALIAGVERTAGSVAAFEGALNAQGLRWERWDVTASAGEGGWACWGGAGAGGAVVGWVVEGPEGAASC